MKMIKVKSLAVVAAASVALYGCASTDDTTAMDDSVSMSETQTMGGTSTDDPDAVVVTADVVAPIATIPIATLSLENTEEINDMFENVDETENYTLMELAKKSPNLSTFVQLMEASGLAGDFQADREYTLFAPTNEAFAKLSKEELEMLILPENKAKLSKVLMTHILPSEVAASSFNETQRIKLNDDMYIPISTSMGGTQITVGGANIVRSNIEASNGLIHIVDNVIIPSQAAVDGDLR